MPHLVNPDLPGCVVRPGAGDVEGGACSQDQLLGPGCDFQAARLGAEIQESCHQHEEKKKKKKQTQTHTETRGYVVGHEDGIFEVRGEISNMRRILCYLEMTRDERRPAEREDDEGWLVTDRSKMVASLFTNWNHILSLF